MKAREPRVRVVVKARMRLSGAWADVCIRNISSRGLLIQAPTTPPRGTYVEVHRGRHVIVARVAWCSEQQFGVQTQDKLNVDAIVKEPDLSAVNYQKVVAAEPAFERRSSERGLTRREAEWAAERNRHLSKAAEFACIGAFGVAAAFLVFEGVSGTFGNSLTRVSAGLSGR